MPRTIPENARAQYDARDVRAPVPSRVSATAGGAHADLDDASSRAVLAGVPRGSCARIVPRSLSNSGAGLRGHAPADRRVRVRRRDPVLRHPDHAAGDGPRRRVPGLRAEDRHAGPHPRRDRCAHRPRSDVSPRALARGDPSDQARARGARAADRLRGRAAHDADLRGRRRWVQGLRPHQEAPLRRSGGGARAARQARTDLCRVPRGAGGGGRRLRPDLRQLGRHRLARGLSRVPAAVCQACDRDPARLSHIQGQGHPHHLLRQRLRAVPR